MKVHSEEFKEQIKLLGRQQDVLIEYTENDEKKTLTVENINGVTPSFESNLLKSVMKQLEIDSNINIPTGTEIAFKYGLLVNGAFEYLDYGKYIVYSSEKQEDTGSYIITCYDKLINSMKNYEKLDITYPVTVRDYIIKLAEKLGLEFKNKEETFVNYDKELTVDFFEGIGFTYRDVLDDLAEVTASIICLDNEDKLELRDINETNDTIDEEYLKDTNVSFGETFGEINSVVLSRSSSDNIYRKDDESIAKNGLCEIKISDNQIMNNNDRDQYIDGIFNKLKGLTYPICDFTSTGIMYYDLLDKFNVKVGDNIYPVVMFNNEQDITQGLEEQIYADKPETSETDYTKADKTDQKINQTNLIVDKQNQTIQGLISQNTEFEEKLVEIEASVDGISQKVETLADLTRISNGIKTVTLENCIAGSLLELNILGNNTVFDYLYPADDLYPSDDLFPYGDSLIEVTNYPSGSEEGTAITYDLGITDVLRQNGDIKDEYLLKEGKAQIIRRINKDGTIKEKEEIEELGQFTISLLEGTNEIEIKNYTANLSAKYAIKSDYTDIFATKVEMQSSITQTAEEINLEVRKKVDENEIISSINQSAEQISISANKLNLNGAITANGNFKIDKQGNMEANNGKFNGGQIKLSGKYTTGGDSSNLIIDNNSNAKLNLFSNRVDLENKTAGIGCSMSCGDSSSGVISSVGCTGINGTDFIDMSIEDSSGSAVLSCGGNGQYTYVRPSGITTPVVNQTSLENIKKNISIYNEKALETILNSDIYTYNLKSEKDVDKKHIGFVIGDKYRTPKEVMNNEQNGIELYSAIGILWKAIQEHIKEQNEEIEQLKQEIENLKKGEK